MRKISFTDAVHAQPDALQVSINAVTATVGGLPSLVEDPASTLTICAMGASTHAAETLVSLARQAGRTIINPPASTWSSGATGTWRLGISESGRSPEPIAALRHGSGFRAALTNVAGSPITEVADLTLDLGDVPDAGVYVTGFTGALAALALIAERMGVPSATQDLAHAPALTAAVLADVGPAIDGFIEGLQRPRSVDAVGSGHLLGVAAEQALLAREAARLPSAAFEIGQFVHGPAESVAGDTLLILFGDHPYDLPGVLPSDAPIIRVTTSSTRGIEVEQLAGHRLDIRLPGEQSFTTAIAATVVAQLVVGALSDGSFEIGTFRHEFTQTKLP